VHLRSYALDPHMRCVGYNRISAVTWGKKKKSRVSSGTLDQHEYTVVTVFSGQGRWTDRACFVQEWCRAGRVCA